MLNETVVARASSSRIRSIPPRSGSSAIGWLTSSSPSSNVIYTITVPSGTPSGTYVGYLHAKAMASHKFAEPGTGLLVQVTVPSLCSGVPTLTEVKIAPEVIWPPDQRGV